MKKPIITEFVVTEIIENPDLKKLLPAVDEVAKEQLKALIEAEGIREPLSLAVIEGQNVLLDGHNRLRVAKELGYVTIPAVFYDDITDIIQAEIWMVHNQLARRNMSDMERIQVILKLEPELKEQAKARQRGEVHNSAQVGKVVQILADMAEVSRNTINQVKAILATGDANLIAIADKDISINKAFKYAGFSEEKRKAKIQAVIQKVSKKAEETTDEEPEVITAIRNKEKIELKKETELSWIQRINEKHFWVYGVKLSDNKNTTTSAIHVFNNNCALVDLPETVTNKIFTIFDAFGNDDKYNEILTDIATLADNIKTAKRLADPALKIARQAYFEAHPEAKPPKAPKPPTAKQLEIAEKKMEKAKAKLIKLGKKEAKDAERVQKRIARKVQKAPKPLTAKQLEKVDKIKKEIEELLRKDEYIRPIELRYFRKMYNNSKMEPEALLKAMKAEETLVKNEIEDADKFSVIVEKYILTPELKEALSKAQYHPEEKSFKLRYREDLAIIEQTEKKPKAPKTAKATAPLLIEAPEPQAVATKKKPAKTPVKAPAKAMKKTTKSATNKNALSADDKKDIAEYFNNNEEVQSVLRTIKKGDNFNPANFKIGDVSFTEALRIMKERKETAMQNMIDNPKVVTSAEVFGSFGENIRAGIEKAARKKATATTDTPKETLPE